MSRFFIGQPVRVVRVANPEFSFYVGREGRVIEAEEHPFLPSGEIAYGLDFRPIDRSDGFQAWSSGQLEPILPEGAAPSEFESLRDLLDSLERVRA